MRPAPDVALTADDSPPGMGSGPVPALGEAPPADEPPAGAPWKELPPDDPPPGATAEASTPPPPSCSPASFEASRTAIAPPAAPTAAPTATDPAALAIPPTVGVALPREAPLMIP